MGDSAVNRDLRSLVARYQNAEWVPMITVVRRRGSENRLCWKGMASTLGFPVSSILLIGFLASPAPLAAQVLTTTSARTAQSNTASTSVSAEKLPSPLPNQDAQEDFRMRVEARWKAARKGQIEVYLVPDAANSKLVVRVVVTRAPAGSDGMKAVSSPRAANSSALLKLDDEVLVRLSPETPGTLEVGPQEPSPSTLIRHLDPGGHAEWTWTVRKIGRGGNRLLLQADVVYRRRFSAEGAPVVAYPSAKLPFPLDALPKLEK